MFHSLNSKFASINSRKRHPEDVLSMLKRKCKLEVWEQNFLKDRLSSRSPEPVPLKMKDFTKLLESDPQKVFAGINGVRFLLSDIEKFIARWSQGDDPGEYRNFESFDDYRFWYVHSQFKDRGRGPDEPTKRLLEESITQALDSFLKESVKLIFSSVAPARCFPEGPSINAPKTAASGITLVPRGGKHDRISSMFQTRAFAHLLQKDSTPENPYFLTFTSDVVSPELFAPYLSVFIASDDPKGVASLASPLSEAAVKNCFETKSNISLDSSPEILTDALRSVVRSMDALN